MPLACFDSKVINGWGLMLGHTIHLSFSHKMEGMEGIHLNFFECLSDYSLILPNAWSFLGFYLPLSFPPQFIFPHIQPVSLPPMFGSALLSIFSIPFAPLIFYFFSTTFYKPTAHSSPLKHSHQCQKSFSAIAVSSRWGEGLPT